MAKSKRKLISKEVQKKIEDINLKDLILWLNYKYPKFSEYQNEILGSKIEDETKDLRYNYIPKRVTADLDDIQISQLALDNYINRWNHEIGKIYERQIGHHYESLSFDVEYHGIVKSLEDLGIDLICKNEYRHIIIQAKCWSEKVKIREKYIFQLYGAKKYYAKAIGKKEAEVEALFIATNSFSEQAKKAARLLGIKLKKIPLNKKYPQIKCNISKRTGKRLYFLPFDNHYDTIKIEKEKGEFFAKTVLEAETKGFRRPKAISRDKVA